jgi:pSer/pThr/pTyr-binding forkhead associated (FHA) protein
MSNTTHPTPVGPFTASADAQATDRLEPTSRELILDALELLDHRSHERTIAPHLALRGHYLAFGDGDDVRLLAIDRDVTHIGRGTSAEVRLDEQRVSRDHAILVRHGRSFRLLDNRSSNGTFVNGRRIVATNIGHGDAIEIGPVFVRFVEVR